MKKNFVQARNFLIKNQTAVKVIICLMYLAGFLGLVINDTRPIFLKLIAFNLWVSLIFLLIFHEDWNRKSILQFCSIYILGFTIEVLGVKTGVIFGEYFYGRALGVKLFDVPISIGVNWLLLSYSSSYFWRQIFQGNKITISAIAFISSISMVILDFLIEPIAIKFGFWDWSSSSIPIQNYLSWFIISFAFNFWILDQKFIYKNKIANLMFILQVLFFMLHNLVA